jgi:hypothetical protein
VRPSRPYPPGLCAYLADLLISPLRLRREGDQPAEQRGDLLVPGAKPEQILASRAFFPFAAEKGKNAILAGERGREGQVPTSGQVHAAGPGQRKVCLHTTEPLHNLPGDFRSCAPAQSGPQSLPTLRTRTALHTVALQALCAALQAFCCCALAQHGHPALSVAVPLLSLALQALYLLCTRLA